MKATKLAVAVRAAVAMSATSFNATRAFMMFAQDRPLAAYFPIPTPIEIDAWETAREILSNGALPGTYDKPITAEINALARELLEQWTGGAGLVDSLTTPARVSTEQALEFIPEPRA